jgi:hypothetical protein
MNLRYAAEHIIKSPRFPLIHSHEAFGAAMGARDVGSALRSMFVAPLTSAARSSGPLGWLRA